MVTITFSNAGGKLEQQEALDGEDARKKLMEMIQAAGSILPGDVITVTGYEEVF
jgi:hypothetical protein